MSRKSRKRVALSQFDGKVRITGDAVIGKQLSQALRPGPKSDPRALTHGFHPWPARLHPHTARTLLRATHLEGSVADPFMGGGTVMVEAMCAGRQAVGSDINPVALEVAWARTQRWSAKERATLQGEAKSVVLAARELRATHPRAPDGFAKTEKSWYDPPALMEVWSLAATLRDVAAPPIRRMLRTCLSSILVKVSKQATDSITKIDQNHQWIPRGRVESAFIARVREHCENLVALNHAVKGDTPNPILTLEDARTAPRSIDKNVAFIISSPPYPGTYDYVDHHRRRYHALELDPHLAQNREIGARREQRSRGVKIATQNYIGDISAVLNSWKGVMVPKGRIYLAIGDGQSPEGVIPIKPMMVQIAKQTQLEFLAIASQSRAMRGHVRGRGKTKNKEEHLFALEVK